jgi:hypothetical protein
MHLSYSSDVSVMGKLSQSWYHVFFRQHAIFCHWFAQISIPQGNVPRWTKPFSSFSLTPVMAANDPQIRRNYKQGDCPLSVNPEL